MRIERIVVTRFGPLRDLDIPLPLPPAGGMIVVEGPNEAGKSTLLRFIRALLFGGESAHGALVVEHGGGRYRIEQRGARGTLALTDLDSGHPVDSTRLPRMLGNLDANVYRQIFAFGLAELQALNTLTAEGVQERIFSATVAGAGGSVRDVQRGLANRIQELWRPRSASAIRTAAQALREALRLSQEAQRAAEEWPRLHADEDELATRIASAEQRMETLQSDLRQTELLLDLHDRWSARREAREQLAEAPEGEPVPDEAVERAGTLRTQIDLLRDRDLDLSKKLADLEPAASAVVSDEDLLPLAGRIAAVSASLPVQRQRLEEDIPKSRANLRAAETLLAAALAPLGPDWTEERVAGFPLAAPSSTDIHGFADEFEALKRERIQAEASHRTRTESLSPAREEVESRRAAGADLGWIEDEREIRSLVAGTGVHRSRVDRLDLLGADLEEGQANLKSVLTRLGPAWDEDRVLAFSAHAEWRRAGEDAGALADRAADERRKGQTAIEPAETHLQACRDATGLLTQPERTAAEAEQTVRALRAEIASLEEIGGTLQEQRQNQQDKQAAETALAAAATSLRGPRRWPSLVVAVALPLLLAAWLARSFPLGSAVLALLAVVLAVLDRPRRDDPAAQATVERARGALEEAERRLEALGRRLKELGEAAGLGEVDLGSVNGALSRARARQADLEREWDACRAWEAAAEALRQAEERLSEARAQAEAAEGIEGETRLRWRRWCEDHGVPDHARPADLPAVLTDLDRAKELARGLTAARTETATLTAAVEDWRKRVERLAARLPEGRPPAPEQAVDALLHELERAADLRRAEADLQDAERQQANSARALDDADRALAGLRERWGGWCRDAGLPDLAAPEDAATWVRDARAAADQAARVQALRTDAVSLRGRSTAWEEQATGVLADAGRPVPDGGSPLVTAVETVAEDLRKAQGGIGEREHARDTRTGLAKELEATRAEIDAKETEIATLLAGCGAESEADLAERVQWQAKRRGWERTVREAEDELSRRAGQDAGTIARLLDDDAPLRWHAEVDRLRERDLPALQAELNDAETGLRARMGALRNRRETLEVGGDVARNRLEVEQRKGTLASALRRWAVCCLADAMIGETLGEYERSRVPDVIRSAGERFARITVGRYHGVYALEGGRLRVAAGEDAVLNATDLSRGTQEQLYLAVRLGLVDSFSRQSESLPLVLDDVLVNSDPERQEGLIRVLADAAEDHQTIVLTCHPETGVAIRREAMRAHVVRLARIAEPARAAPTPVAAEARAPDPGLSTMALAALRENAEGLGAAQLGELLGIRPGEIKDVLASLLESGTVVREGRTRGTRYRLQDGMTA